MDERPSYWAVIPAQVRYDESIPANAKLLYGEVSALIGEDGYCYAGNGYFAALYGVTEVSISRLFKQLEEAGHIHRDMEKDKNGQVVRRKIYLDVSVPREQPLNKNVNTPKQNCGEGINKNVKETNSNNNKKENKKKKSATVPPLTEDELQARTKDWVAQHLANASRAEKNAVFFAVLNYYAPREKTPSRYPAAVTTAFNRLLRFSNGDPYVMLSILEEAVQKKWQGIYPGDGHRVSLPVQSEDNMQWG